MKFVKYNLAILLTLLYIPLALAQASESLWATIDDQTGKERSIVRLTETEDTISGTIVKVFKQKGDTGNCSKCPDQFKNKSVEGLEFLWGLKKLGKNHWTGGNILDPKSGKIYRAKITVKGDKLYVRGYVGLSMLGRTQIWYRTEA